MTSSMSFQTRSVNERLRHQSRINAFHAPQTSANIRDVYDLQHLPSEYGFHAGMRADVGQPGTRIADSGRVSRSRNMGRFEDIPLSPPQSAGLTAQPKYTQRTSKLQRFLDALRDLKNAFKEAQRERRIARTGTANADSRTAQQPLEAPSSRCRGTVVNANVPLRTPPPAILQDSRSKPFPTHPTEASYSPHRHITADDWRISRSSREITIGISQEVLQDATVSDPGSDLNKPLPPIPLKQLIAQRRRAMLEREAKRENDHSRSSAFREPEHDVGTWALNLVQRFCPCIFRGRQTERYVEPILPVHHPVLQLHPQRSSAPPRRETRIKSTSHYARDVKAWALNLAQRFYPCVFKRPLKSEELKGKISNPIPLVQVSSQWQDAEIVNVARECGGVGGPAAATSHFPPLHPHHADTEKRRQRPPLRAAMPQSSRLGRSPAQGKWRGKSESRSPEEQRIRGAAPASPWTPWQGRKRAASQSSFACVGLVEQREGKEVVSNEQACDLGVQAVELTERI